MIKLPSKRKAVEKLNRMVLAGKIIRQPCQVCGKKRKIEGHHSDYNKPLDVMWLCKKHHAQWHKENGYPKGINYINLPITRNIFWKLKQRMAEMEIRSMSVMIEKLLKKK